MSSQQLTEEDIVITGKVPKSQRIMAFDLIRGLFLLIIMIDHIELYPNGWDIFTGKGRMWVSAAEGFFFLSGLLIGMIYKRRLHLGMQSIFKKMWLRAAELYVVGTTLTFLYVCWVEFTHHAPIKDSLPSPLPWHHIIEQTLLMRFTYGWGDFLVRFAILMLIAPFVFYVVAKGRWKLALAGIFIAWFFRRDSFTLAWQLIFNLGIIVGFYWNRLRAWFGSLKRQQKRRIKISVAAAAGITFLLSYASVYFLGLLRYFADAGHLSLFLRHVLYTGDRLNDDIWKLADKWTMGPLRVLLFFLWFTALYWVTRRYEQPIIKYSRGILELLGRNSLFVYTVHSVIVFILKMYVIPPKTSFIQNFLITTVGMALLVAITKGYKLLEPSLSQIQLVKIRSAFSARI